MHAPGRPTARSPLGSGRFALLTLLVVPLSFASAGSAQPIVFDALNVDNGQWTLDPWTQIRPDGLHLTSSKMVWAYDFIDGYAELHTEHVSGALDQGYGMSFRCARRNGEANVSGYVFYIASNGGWRLLKFRHASYEPMVDWQACPFLHQGLGEWNILGVLCRGSQFKLFLNGRAVALANDTDFPDGGVGPASAGAEGSDVAFRYLILDPKAQQDEVRWAAATREELPDAPQPTVPQPGTAPNTLPPAPGPGGAPGAAPGGTPGQPGRAGQPTLGGSLRPDPADPGVITITLNAILGPDGRPLSNLSPANFQVFEDGAPREVVSVQQANTGTRTNVDLAFILDQTESMKEEIQGVSDSVVRFADFIAGRGVGIRLAGLAFRDDVDMAGACPFSDDYGRLKAWAGQLRATEGGDPPENALDAIMAAVQSFQWRPDAQRLLVVITDASMHIRGRGRTQYWPEKVAGELRAGGFALHSVSRGTVQSGLPDAKVLSEATGGLWIRMPANGRVDLTSLPLTDVVLAGQVIKFRSTPTNTQHRVRVVLVLNGQPAAEQEFACQY